MNPNIIIIAVLSFFSISRPILWAQREVGERIQRQLADYCMKIPWEDLYVQTDRDYYISGEDLWLNIIAADRQSGKLVDLSRIAYSELINLYNISVVRKRILLESGKGPGHISLPDTLGSGIYTLRVYTNWMKNFLPGNCFMKEIYIYNPFRSGSFRKKISHEEIPDKKLNIGFFPEGGALISDIRSKVAVRITDPYVREASYSGIIRDNSGDTITIFGTDVSGFGSFEFTPQRGVHYYAQVGGQIADLPEISDTGFSIYADNSHSTVLSVLVSLKENAEKEFNGTFLLIIQAKGIINYSQFHTLTGKEIEILIPKEKLLPGINHITLFSDDGRPVCERLILTRDIKLPPLILSGDNIFNRRERVVADLDLSSVGLKSSTNSCFGISVVSVESYSDSRDIEDYFVFGTEFGPLPGIFRNKKIRDIDDATIDNYLLTAESRWLSWGKILNKIETDIEFLPETDGHYLTGIIRKGDSEEIVPGELVYLSIPGKTATFQYCITDSSGYFRFLLTPDQSDQDLIIQPAKPDDRITIRIESSFAPELTLPVVFSDTIKSAVPGFVTDFSAGYQIDKIYKISHRTEPCAESFPSEPKARFYGIPETELKIDDYIRLPAMQEIFFELTPGIKLRSRRTGYEMRVINPVDNFIYEDPPLVMIDGVVINDISILADLNTEYVDRIEAIRTSYLTGGLIHYGIINVITHKGNFENITLPDYVARLNYRVADPVPLFKAPDYSEIGLKNSRIPEFRNTVFWAPSLYPDDHGNVHAAFWTPDRSGNYVINIQGITDEGKFISVRKIITVE